MHYSKTLQLSIIATLSLSPMATKNCRSFLFASLRLFSFRDFDLPVFLLVKTI